MRVSFCFPVAVGTLLVACSGTNDSQNLDTNLDDSGAPSADCGVTLNFDPTTRQLNLAEADTLGSLQLEVSWYNHLAWMSATLSPGATTADLRTLVPHQMDGFSLQETHGTGLRFSVSGQRDGAPCESTMNAEMPTLDTGDWMAPEAFIVDPDQDAFPEAGFSTDTVMVRLDLSEEGSVQDFAGHVIVLSLLGDVLDFVTLDPPKLGGTETAQATNIDFQDGLIYGSTVSYPGLTDGPPSYTLTESADGPFLPVETSLTLHDGHEITGMTDDGLLIVYSLDWSQAGDNLGSTIIELLIDPETGEIQESSTLLDWTSVLQDGSFSNYHYFNFLNQPIDSPWLCTTQRMNMEVRLASSICFPLDAEGRASTDDMILIANEGYTEAGLPENFAIEFPNAQVIELPRLSDDPEQFVVDGPHAAYWLPDPADPDRATWVGHMLIEKVGKKNSQLGGMGAPDTPTTTYLYDMQRDNNGDWSPTLRCGFSDGHNEFFYGTVIIPGQAPELMAAYYADNRSMTLFGTADCSQIGQLLNPVPTDTDPGQVQGSGKWNTARSMADVLDPLNGLENEAISFQLE